jgi:hypothetical protein
MCALMPMRSSGWSGMGTCEDFGKVHDCDAGCCEDWIAGNRLCARLWCCGNCCGTDCEKLDGPAVRASGGGC